MSRFPFIRRLTSRLKGLLHWPWHWSLPSWHGFGTIAAFGISVLSLVISGLTLCFQFLPRYETTATSVELSTSPLDIHSADTLQVSVELAVWNQGQHPAVILSGGLLFDTCRDLRSAEFAALAEQMPPFLVSPGQVVLRTLRANILLSFVSGSRTAGPNGAVKTFPSAFTGHFNGPNAPVETELALWAQCDADEQGTSKKIYVGVELEAMQSNGKLAESSDAVGVLFHNLTTGLNLNDKYGRIGATPMGKLNPWLGEVPKFAKPFSVIPAQDALSKRE